MRKEPPVTPSDPADPPVEPAAGSFPTGGTHQLAGGVVPTTATPLAAGLDEQIHQARNELYALLTNPPEHTRAALNLWRQDLRRRRREVERLERLL